MPLRLYPPGQGAGTSRGPHWKIRGAYLGVHVDRSAGTDREALARKELRRIEREIEDGGQPVRRAQPTFADAALSYLSGCPVSEVPYVNRLLDHFKATALSAINQTAIDDCAARLHPGAKPATINRNCLTPLAAVLHHAAEREMCGWVRVRKRKEPRGRVRWIEPDQAERLLSACNDRLRPLALFLLFTGARLNEAISLDWERVDLVRRHAVFADTKNGETYGVPLGERLWLALANMPGPREGRVFGYWDRWAVYRDWRLACKTAGISDFTPHDCRHTFATWLRQAGKDMRALMELGRWKDTKSVARYSHVSSSELRDAVDSLPLNVPVRKA